MKIAFYMENKNHKNVDFSSPEKGNPGIGGTQFMFWLISCYLTKLYSDLDIYLIANHTETFPKYIKGITVADSIECLNKSQGLSIDILVIRTGNVSLQFIEELKKTNIKVVLWSHNFENYETMQLLSNCKNIKRNVCVGKEQYDFLRDQEIFKKSTYIYNTISQDLYDNFIRIDNDAKKVCYMGALVKAKGFSRLAAVWNKIEKEVPDAELYVIGGSSLYNENSKVGKFNLSDSDFENEFIKYLTDDYGNIRKNIHFLGVLNGEEKMRVMQTMSVAVIPSTETFCISAIEFESLGVPVVAKKQNGLLDTVSNNHTGILFNSDREMVKSVVKLLKNKNLNLQLGKNGPSYVKQKFNIDNVLKKWYNLLIDVYYEKPQIPEYKCAYHFNNLKWVFEVNRRLQRLFPFLPSLLYYKKAVKKHFKKFVNWK